MTGSYHSRLSLALAVVLSLSVNLLWLPVDAFGASTATDPSVNLARQLWIPDYLKAVVAVHADVPNGDGTTTPADGSGFMISDGYAITAGHVVCNEKAHNLRADAVHLYIGGANGAVPDVQSEAFECYPSGIDVAIVKVPRPTTGRPHLNPATMNELTSNPFITSFGFGGNLDGRYLVGYVQLGPNHQLQPDNENLIRIELGAEQGDSGGPVLDDTGNVIGEIIAGNSVSTTAIVPLAQLAEGLTEVGISLTSSTPPALSPASNSLAGIVSIQLGVGPSGTWPSPPTRLANPNEIQLDAFFGANSGDPAMTFTGNGGTWTVSVPDASLNPNTPYFIVLSKADDAETPIAQHQLFADPVGGTLGQAVGKPQSLTIYERSAYVRVELSQAVALQELSDDNSNLITSADAKFRRAYTVSALDPSNIGISTQISFRWASFQARTGRPCQAVKVIRDLTDSFQTDSLTPPLIRQALDATVQCQVLPDSASAIMSWRTPTETRQEASVRFINETLERFAPKAKALQSEAPNIMADLLTALEAYKDGSVVLSVAAKTISADSELSGFLSSFAKTYVTNWCKLASPKNVTDVKQIEAFLIQMRSHISSCGEAGKGGA